MGVDLTSSRAIIAEVVRRRVELRAEGEHLLYRPRERVDAALLAAMREHKAALVFAARAEWQRSACVGEAWRRLQIAFASAGEPSGWLTSEGRFAEDAVEKLWVSARIDPADDRRFYQALRRWEAVVSRSIRVSSSDGREGAPQSGGKNEASDVQDGLLPRCYPGDVTR